MTNMEQIENLRKEIKEIYSPSIRLVMNDLITASFLLDDKKVEEAILSLKELREYYLNDKEKQITNYKEHKIMADGKYITEKLNLFKNLYFNYVKEDVSFTKDKQKEALNIIKLLESLN